MSNFQSLNLAHPILKVLAEENYTTPTPIQAKAIPALMEGRDLMGIAQTGTGKTASFALPILHHMAVNPARAEPRRPQAVILAPTRELAGQIHHSIKTYSKFMKLRSTVVFGGVSFRPQIRSLTNGVHILVATPGRLLDLMNQNHVQLDDVEFFVLDEADRMLDMGFVHDVRKVADELPDARQTVLFSATMPKNVQALAEQLMDNPLRVEVAPAATTAERIDQQVLFVPKEEKRALLGDVLADKDIRRVLIFTRTKHGADRVTQYLQKLNITAQAIHGDKTQGAREKALKGFRSGQIRALVATDIAARGIDVDGVTHVINYDLPNEPESYVHRIGRTARAGAEGIAISFCAADEVGYLKDIEKTIRQPITVFEDHPYHVIHTPVAPPKRGQRSRPGNKPQRTHKPNAGNKPQRQSHQGGDGRAENQNKPTRAKHRRPRYEETTTKDEQRDELRDASRNGQRKPHRKGPRKDDRKNDASNRNRDQNRDHKRSEKTAERSSEHKGAGDRPRKRPFKGPNKNPKNNGNSRGNSQRNGGNKRQFKPAA